MTASPDCSEVMMMTLQITFECALMLSQNVQKISNVIFSKLVFCPPDIKQHKYVAMKAQKAGDFPSPSSSVAPDPLLTHDLAPLNATSLLLLLFLLLLLIIRFYT